jgi:PiT family inorganic phosphate transporter
MTEINKLFCGKMQPSLQSDVFRLRRQVEIQKGAAGSVIATSILLIIAIATALYMAWSIGANDVANSMASAVGGKAISLKQAVIIAGILEMSGAVLLGEHVTKTVGKGIVELNTLGDYKIVIVGMLASLLAAAIGVTLATWKELPVSTSHFIVGAVIGFGIVAGGGIGGVNWLVMGAIALSWVISPIAGLIISYIVFKLIARFVLSSEDPVRSALRGSPVYVGLTFFIIAVSLNMKTSFGKKLGISDNISMILLVSSIVGIVTGITGYYLIKRAISRWGDGEDRYLRVERIFRNLQIMTSCYVAFAHGANDVANAIGPLGTLFLTVSSPNHIIPTGATIPWYLLALGGFGISLGVFTWGYKVIKTIGFKITELTNTRGYSIDFGVATTVLIFSKLGMPISTTHTVVGAVVGVGLARGLAAVDLRVLRNIVISWLLTIPLAVVLSIGLYMGLCQVLM